jgi:ribonuclease HI
MGINSKTPAPVGTTATIFTDGSCPENPGPMGIGYTLDCDDRHENERIIEIGYRLGPGTNNQAEYLALIAALRHALLLCCTGVIVYSDSLLIVNQVSGAWKCNDGRLKRLHEEAVGLKEMFSTFKLSHIPREENQDADVLSKNPTPETLPPSTYPDFYEDSDKKPPQKISRCQAAMIRWWWATGRCRNEYRLGRIFGVTNSYCGRIGRGEKWGLVNESDLPGSARADLAKAIDGMPFGSKCKRRERAVQERSPEKEVPCVAGCGPDRPKRGRGVRPGKRGAGPASNVRCTSFGADPDCRPEPKRPWDNRGWTPD